MNCLHAFRCAQNFWRTSHSTKSLTTFPHNVCRVILQHTRFKQCPVCFYLPNVCALKSWSQVGTNCFKLSGQCCPHSPVRYIDIDCRYIDTFEKYRYRYWYGHFENIDIDMVILKISKSISIRQFWKVWISIRQFWKYRYQYR